MTVVASLNATRLILIGRESGITLAIKDARSIALTANTTENIRLAPLLVAVDLRTLDTVKAMNSSYVDEPIHDTL